MSMHALHKPDPKTFLYQTNEKPFGTSYEDWTKKWWQWLLDIQFHQNPANDSSGVFAHQNQKHSEVFFLAGAVNRRAKRSVGIIPRNKAIFFPIVCVEDSLIERPQCPVNELKKFSQNASDDMISLKAIIDEGTENEVVLWTGELSRYRVSSDPFDLKLTQNNLFTHQGGDTKAAADGYWCFIKENFLKPGDHTIWFQGLEEYYQTETAYSLKIQ